MWKNIIFLFVFYSMQIVAQDTLKTIVLPDLKVEAEQVVIKGDHYDVYPTGIQKKHAHSGYDLLRNIMIPGMTVDRKSGTVLSNMGKVGVYIDGREATFQEVQSLRSKDIKSFEYYEIATGNFAKNPSAINFVMKEMKHGGYTQADAEHGIGANRADYNLVSKYSFDKTAVSLWAGYIYSNFKEKLCMSESFIFPDSELYRTSEFSDRKNVHDGYVQADIIRSDAKHMLMIQPGLRFGNNESGIESGQVEYSGKKTGYYTRKNTDHNDFLMPSLYLYERFSLPKKQTLNYTLNSRYSRNTYDRFLEENNQSFNLNTTEDFLYANASVNYIKQFRQNSTLTLKLHEFFRASSVHYSNTTTLWQRLWESETIFFADYTQNLGKWFLQLSPGVSYMNYRLHGSELVTSVGPRMQMAAMVLLSKKQRLQFTYSLGNSFPEIASLNKATQQVDFILKKQGNLDLRNTILMGPSVTYTQTSGKFTTQLSGIYTYMNHVIVRNYSPQGDCMMITFLDNASSHQPVLRLSSTWKYSPKLNMKVDASWQKNIVRGVINKQRNTWSAGITANYYTGDFSFSLSCKTPQHTLIDYMVFRNQPWTSTMNTEWSHGRWAAEFELNNLLFPNKGTKESMRTTHYDFSQNIKSELYKFYASLKVYYSIDYGKQTSKVQRYNRVDLESGILK